MMTARDIIKRMGVGGQLVPFFKCMCVYFLVGGGGTGPSALAVGAKCAPVLCLLLAVGLHQHSLPKDQRGYARCVCVGLALSALGDALLVWETQLVRGMGAFAGAHLAYVCAFGWRPVRARVGAACALGAALYVCALRRAPDAALRALVPLYAALLALMAWRGAARGGPAQAGALLFLLSDAILGRALFADPLPYSEVLVMSTYYLGQLGIATSALRPPPAAAE